MKRLSQLLWIAPLVLVLCFAGCAKKKAVAEAAPPPPAETAPAATPPPAPAPEPTPPPAPSIQDQLVDVLFDTDSATLTQTAQGILDGDGKLLTGNAATNVTIEGNCDERGTVEYNQALGDRRAQAAKDYLVRYGITDGRMSTISYGEEKPVDPGHDEGAWAKNRRVHLAVR
jgi:peptidoglycan-associated lipoprotein